jgi:hypothetical protein
MSTSEITYGDVWLALELFLDRDVNVVLDGFRV